MGCLPVLLLFALGLGVSYVLGGEVGGVWGAGIGVALGLLVMILLLRAVRLRRQHSVNRSSVAQVGDAPELGQTHQSLRWIRRRSIVHTISHHSVTNTSAKASEGTYSPKRGVIQSANSTRYQLPCPSNGRAICISSEPA